jgi:hypothetical protein
VKNYKQKEGKDVNEKGREEKMRGAFPTCESQLAITSDTHDSKRRRRAKQHS